MANEETPGLDKAALMHRWKREGRWEEVNRYRVGVRRVQKAAGAPKREAADRAWAEAAVVFPVITDPEAAAFFISGEEPVKKPAKKSVKKRADRAVAGTVGILPSHWGKLAETAGFDVEVEWVHQNRVLVVEERSGGKSVLHWYRARSAAPSYGAVSLMEYASTNRKGFMDILQRTKPKGEGDEEGVGREKRSLGEIRSLLVEMAEVPA